LALLQPDMIDMIMEKQPQKKESEEYNKWTTDVMKMAEINVGDHDTSRDICACAMYLNVS